MESPAQFFHALMPHVPTLFFGIVLGVGFGVVIAWLLRPRPGRRMPSALWPFGLLVVGVFSFLATHAWLVHETGSLRVLGGFHWTPDAARFAASSPGTTRVEVISAFNGWEDPERVWTPGSLLMARILAASTLALLIAGMIALGRRLPSFFVWLTKFWRGSG